MRIEHRRFLQSSLVQAMTRRIRVRPILIVWFAFHPMLFATSGGSGIDRSTSSLMQIAVAQENANQPEAISLFGKPLYRPGLSPEQQQSLDAKLMEALIAYNRNPNNLESIIWLGRRTAYLGRYREAIEIFSRGIEKHPNEANLYRHRGHRYITIREFDKAIADLERAAKLIEGVPDEIEPDGQPNKFNIPTSTSHSNIWYHLGLAYYLNGDFRNALRCYQECMKFSTANDDMLSATSHWLYMTYRRLGRAKEAQDVLGPIHADMKILENAAYHNLLLMYKGQRTPEALFDPNSEDALNQATIGYGIGNWHLYNGSKEKAEEIFRKILDGSYWSAFGYIAAEADLKRPQ